MPDAREKTNNRGPYALQEGHRLLDFLLNDGACKLKVKLCSDFQNQPLLNNPVNNGVPRSGQPVHNGRNDASNSINQFLEVRVVVIEPDEQSSNRPEWRGDPVQ